MTIISNQWAVVAQKPPEVIHGYFWQFKGSVSWLHFDKVTAGSRILFKEKISNAYSFLATLLWIVTTALQDKLCCMIRDTIFSLQRQYLSDDRLCISESLSDKCEPTGQIQPCPIKVSVDVTSFPFPLFSLKTLLNMSSIFCLCLTGEAALTYGSEKSTCDHSWSAANLA